MEQNFNEISDSFLESAASSESLEKQNYDDKYILRNLLSGKSRDEIATELNHKNYRTIDMYMRRHGYTWNAQRQLYVKRDDTSINNYESITPTSRVHKIIDLFNKGIDPNQIAKLVSMKDHRAVASYMQAKGYLWSTELQNYILKKGEVSLEDNREENLDDKLNVDDAAFNHNLNDDNIPNKLKALLPMLEMIERNKDKLFELLGSGQNDTIPRYVVGGVTITKSLCMSYPLAELVKEFSKEKNLSQKEIFEVALIEFLKKYGYEQEINALFK